MAITDERIKKDVIDHIFWDNSVDASNINVHVENSQVTLTGTVASYLAQKAAHECVVSVRGVEGINNQLTVVAPPSEDHDDDARVADRIEKVLLWNRHIDESRIEVTVNSRSVTLLGSLDTCWKKKRVEDICGDIVGVQSVVNKLSVVPTQSIADQLIAEDIVNALDRSSRIDVNDIDVQVHDGTVILTGIVSNWEGHQAAGNIAEHTRGVSSLENRLKVSFTALKTDDISGEQKGDDYA